MLLWFFACMQGGMDLSPHLYVLPLELTPFQEVLAALGAQEAFSAAQYTTVLQVCVRSCMQTLCSSECWLLSVIRGHETCSVNDTLTHIAVMCWPCLCLHESPIVAGTALDTHAGPRQ